MHLSISDYNKKSTFISLFQVLKSSSSLITIFFYKEKMYIQGMDPSHVCLFDISILSSWFDLYEIQGEDTITISVHSAFLYTILSMTEDKQTIHLCYQGDSDVMTIDLAVDESTKGEFNKFFTLPLVDAESNLLDIPLVDYDAEFTIHAKKMNELVSQLLNFGDIMNLKCSEETIHIGSKGVGGEMMVYIPMDDLTEFSISEGEEVCLSYSLHYIHKMCITTKLSSEVQFSISHNYPLRIQYDLGGGCSAAFYIAPKIED